MNGVLDDVLRAAGPRVTGRVTRALGVGIEVSGLDVAVGEAVEVASDQGPILAEVVALDGDAARCLPVSDLRGVRRGAVVASTGGPLRVPVGAGLIGRVVDALGRPIDGGPALTDVTWATWTGRPHALTRDRINTRSPSASAPSTRCVPCGRGQRIGIFAGSGVGKSSAAVDDRPRHRGRGRGARPRRRARPRGARVHRGRPRPRGPRPRRRGRRHLRRAGAGAPPRRVHGHPHRRVVPRPGRRRAAADGQPHPLRHGPARGRPVRRRAARHPRLPAVGLRRLLPQLLERAARRPPPTRGTHHRRSTRCWSRATTSTSPIADAARSILDGHIVLSRKLASAGHFPCVDVLESVSRVARASPTPPSARPAALRKLLAACRDAKDLIEIGAYVAGTNPLVDRAVRSASTSTRSCGRTWRTSPTDARSSWRPSPAAADAL